MKYTFAAAALVALVSAQSISDIPACAIPCINDARTSATKCSADDFACICKSQEALTAAATSCVLKECGAEKALNEVLPAVKTFCEKVAEAPAPSPSATSKAEETTKAEPTTEAEPTTKAESSYEVKPTPTEATTTASVATSMSLSVSVTGSMTTAVSSTSAMPTGSSPATHSGSASATASSPIATAGAAHFGIGGAGVLAAIAAFL